MTPTSKLIFTLTIIFLLTATVTSYHSILHQPHSSSSPALLPETTLPPPLSPTTTPTATSPQKTPSLRNAMDNQQGKAFKKTVERQAHTFPESFILEGPNPDIPQVALTFDDGPDQQYTAEILRILEKHNTPATFFLLGENIQRYPAIVQDITIQGHAIGGHSFNHIDCRTLDPDTFFTTQINPVQQLIAKEIGSTPTIWRPPYGAITDEQIALLQTHNITTINWSIDTFDWDNTINNPQEITKRITENLHPGAIILLHSAGGNRSNTIKALPTIITTTRSKGYTLVTIPNLLSELVI